MRPDIARYEKNLKEELDGAALYAALAAAEVDPIRKDLFLQLSQAEAGHAQLWRDKLNAAGVDAELFTSQGIQRGTLVSHEIDRDALRIFARQSLCLEDERQLLALGVWRFVEFLLLLINLGAREFPRIGHRQPFAQRHGNRAGDQPGKAGEQDGVRGLWVANSQSSGNRGLKQTAAMLPPSVTIKRGRSN